MDADLAHELVVGSSDDRAQLAVAQVVGESVVPAGDGVVRQVQRTCREANTSMDALVAHREHLTIDPPEQDRDSCDPNGFHRSFGQLVAENRWMPAVLEPPGRIEVRLVLATRRGRDVSAERNLRPFLDGRHVALLCATHHGRESTRHCGFILIGCSTGDHWPSGRNHCIGRTASARPGTSVHSRFREGEQMDGPSPSAMAPEATPGGVLAQAKRLQALHVIACALSGSLETSEVVERAVLSLLDVTGLSSGCVYLYDDERHLLVAHSPVGFLHELGPLETHRPDTSTFPSRAFRSREPLVFDTADEHHGYASITEVERQTIIPEGLEKGIACRVESSSTNYGVVILCSRDPDRTIDRDDLEFTKVVAGQIGVAIERARLYEDLKRRVLEATTLYEIGRTLGSHVEAATVLPHALDLASLRFGFAGCEVELREPIGGQRRFGSPGVPTPDHAGVAVVSAPLEVGDVDLGRLLAFDSDPPPDDTRRRLRAMADLVAMAVWNSRLSKDRARLGVIEERNRLARDIHDGLTQRFYAIQLQLQSAMHAFEAHDHPAAGHHLGIAAAHADEGVDEARRSVRGLRAPGIDKQSLTELVRDLALRHEADTGTKCQLIIRGDDAISEMSIKAALASSVRELLHNVAKHAAASSVSVVLAFAPDTVSVTVADNGHGISGTQGAADGTGYGFQCIRERMTDLQGSVDLRSTPGQGTVVRLSVPHRPSDGEARNQMPAGEPG